MKVQEAVSVAVMVGVLLTSVVGAEQDKSPYQWEPKVASVMVFKNGLGFYVRQGQVSLRDGWCVCQTIPPALFGTLAVYSHAEDQTVDILAAGPGEVVAFDGMDASDDMETKRQRLEACKFLKLQLTYQQEDTERTAAGKLVSVGPEYVVLQAESSSFAVPLGGIRKLQVLENPLRVHVTGDDQKTPAETTLGMAYLRKGITWIPEYTLVLKDQDTAELTLRGTLVNEAEDLIRCDANFVVGVPHFVHTDYMSPIAVGQAIRTIGAAVPSQVTTQIMTRAAVAFENSARSDQFSGMMGQPMPAGRDLREATGNLPQLDADDASDFTVYARKDLTLRQGEKAIVTLFTNEIRYSHFYRWSPPASIEHSIMLQNDTDTPWTTGPCLVTGLGNTSEDLLRYVPKGGRGELPVTTAVNIATNQKETEAKRDLKAHQPSTNVFLDRVTVNGELMLRNFGKTPADISIDLPLQGKPLTASDEGQIYLSTANLKLTERSGRIYWRVSVQPGASKTLAYAYERYVSSN